MKLTELKKKTADKQAEELRRMLTEAYKAVPAGKREELDRVLFPEENAEDLRSESTRLNSSHPTTSRMPSSA